MPPSENITALLSAARHGDRAALDALFPLLYDELHRLAGSQRRQWHGNYTLNTTALVHEAYLKLVRQDDATWKDRAHFFAMAAKAMRHILINYARDKQTQKRGGAHERASLAEVDRQGLGAMSEEAMHDLLALDDALQQLEALHPRQSQVVECRFFAGLSVQETAEALAISTATVKRDWRLASIWLYHTLGTPLPS